MRWYFYTATYTLYSIMSVFSLALERDRSLWNLYWRYVEWNGFDTVGQTQPLHEACLTVLCAVPVECHFQSFGSWLFVSVHIPNYLKSVPDRLVATDLIYEKCDGVNIMPTNISPSLNFNSTSLLTGTRKFQATDCATEKSGFVSGQAHNLFPFFTASRPALDYTQLSCSTKTKSLFLI